MHRLHFSFNTPVVLLDDIVEVLGLAYLVFGIVTFTEVFDLSAGVALPRQEKVDCLATGINGTIYRLPPTAAPDVGFIKPPTIAWLALRALEDVVQQWRICADPPQRWSNDQSAPLVQQQAPQHRGS